MTDMRRSERHDVLERPAAAKAAAADKPLLYLVAGARPNFMKIAPLVRALRADGRFDHRIVHTGQHYDREMSEVFFEELDIPPPDYNLEAGGGSHAEQTAKVMIAFEKVCLAHRPDWVLVVGDVNSTLACSLVAKKLNIRVAHIEAGLRSRDLRMPEEINRMATDAIADFLFATEPAGIANLLREGHAKEQMMFVGNVMIDNLMFQLAKLEAMDRSAMASTAIKQRLRPGYGVVTLHRPSNVDDAETLRGVLAALDRVSERLPLVFPVHPRTAGSFDRFGARPGPKVVLTPPLSYMDFLNLWKDARLVLTDSGGLQEETTALGIPCVTLRENTERPITVDQGTNIVVGVDGSRIVEACEDILDHGGKRGRRPDLWDGRAAERIVEAMARLVAP